MTLPRQVFFLLIIAALGLCSCAKPVAKFSYATDKKEAPAKVTFTNESKKAENYFWDFGDDKQSNEEMPIHEYKSSGNYEVTLRAYKGDKEHVYKQRVFIEAPKECLVELETAFGTMTILLYNETPEHRDNFVKLVEENFYDDLLFHRVINGFMIQGGDPNSKNAKPNARLGSGGPGYQIPAEFVDEHVHVKGALSAARMGDNVNPQKKSSGSQFYIVHGRPVTSDQLESTAAQKGTRYSKEQIEDYLKNGGTPFLDREYTVFGRVVKGLEVIDAIAAEKTLPGDRPEKDIKMKMQLVK